MATRATGTDALSTVEAAAMDFAKTFVSQAKEDMATYVWTCVSVCVLVFDLMRYYDALEHIRVKNVAEFGASKLGEFIRDMGSRY